jgi:hypothetical protein
VADDEDQDQDPAAAVGAAGHAIEGAATVEVRWASSLDDAHATARRLVERGFGATVAAAPGGGAGYEVRVLPEEATRATEVLDRPDDDEPEGTAATGVSDEPPASVPVLTSREPVPWRTVLPIWLAAMILLPLVAALGTYLLLTH